MPTYQTYDAFPDLTAAEMARAHTMTFAPYTSDSPLLKWDKSASYAAGQSGSFVLLSMQVDTGSKYHIYATSFFDPSMILYDSLGNAVNYTRDDDGDFGTDSFVNWVPAYSGTYYIQANLAQGAYHKAATVLVFEDDRSNNPAKISTGTSGADYFVDYPDLDRIDGKGGIDTMTVFSNRNMYTLVKNGGEISLVSDFKSNEVDVLTSVERIKFMNETVNVEYTDVIQALYVGYFGRPADPSGFRSFQQQLTSLKASENFSDLSARYTTDTAIRKLIDSFGSSDESKALYTGDTAAFVKALYNNILDRAPDAGGLGFWVGAIDSGNLTRANASLSIMSGALSNTSAQGKIDATLITKKISVASNFTFAVDGQDKDASYVGPAAANVARALLVDVDASTDVLGFQQSVNSAVTALSTVRPLAEALHDMHGALAPLIGVNDSSQGAMHYL